MDGCRRGSIALRERGPADPPKPRLLDRVRQSLRARHYSRRTGKSYVAWIRRYIIFHGKRHPAEMGAADVTSLLTALTVNRGPAAVRSPADRMFGA